MAIPKSLDTHDCLIEMGNFEALSPYVIFSASMYRTLPVCIVRTYYVLNMQLVGTQQKSRIEKEKV
jgi:hypothetical protein